MKMRSSKRQTKPKTTTVIKPKPKPKTKTKSKPSDLEQQKPPPVQNDEMDVEYEYEEMDYEDEEFEKPKLAEGFYEIEAVRKKRVRKGKKEYLVKWLGWPESSNSWEPAENLDAVPDLIEAFEESSKSGKRRSGKKGKRKNQNRSQDATYAVPALDLNIIEEPQVLSVHNSNFSNGTDDNAVATVNQPNEIQSFMGSPPAEEVQVRATTSSTNQENVGTENGVCKDGEMVLSQVGLRIGSKRRKTCAVKRFKQSTNSAPTIELVGKTTDVDGKDETKKADNSAATPESAESKIVKIVKPVNYTTSIKNGIEDVCVSLLVRRSDGEETVVDNKYLKENNPILLINYYEKHLRYSLL